MTGPSQFDTIKKPGGVSSILGPSYTYADHIKTPMELGMTDAGGFDNLAGDVRGIVGYVELLVTGSCSGIGACASSTGRNKDGSPGAKYEGPLGNRFFLPTIANCKDKKTKKEVTRSIFINNVPDGSIPLVSNMDSDIAFDQFVGLMPGILSNIAQIHPMQILMSFLNGASPTCQAVTLETVDSNQNKIMDTAYLINSDIDMIPKRWFPPSKPKSNYDTSEDPADENFQTMLPETTIDYSQMPNDTLIKIYYSMLGLIGLYILMNLMLKTKKI